MKGLETEEAARRLARFGPNVQPKFRRHGPLIQFLLPTIRSSTFCWRQLPSPCTKEWSAFVLDMGVAYKEETDRVVGVMRQVGEELQDDPSFRDKFISPIEIIGVDNFADSAVVIRIRIKTRPLEQWNVGREYRRRLKKAFDAQDIEIPFPHRTFYTGSSNEPFKIQMVSAPSASR